MSHGSHASGCDCYINKKYQYKVFEKGTFSATSTTIYDVDDVQSTLFGTADPNGDTVDIVSSDAFNIRRTTTIIDLEDFSVTNPNFASYVLYFELTNIGQSPNDYVQFIVFSTGFPPYDNYIQVITDISDVHTVDSSEIYSGVTHRYLKIQEDNDEITFSYSADGVTYTTLFTQAITSSDNIYNEDVRLDVYMTTGERSSSPTFATTTFDVLIYGRTTYLGLLPNVVSDPSYNWDIASVGTSLDISLAILPEDLPDYVSNGNYIELWMYSGCRTQDETPIMDCEGFSILDCNGDEVFGACSTGYPNGIRKISGFISKINKKYGSDNVVVTVLSHGEDLDNYVHELNLSGQTYAVDQNTRNSYQMFGGALAQTIQFSGNTQANFIDLYLSGGYPAGAHFVYEILEGDPNSSTVVATGESSFFNPTSGAFIRVTFDEITLTAGQQYSLIISADGSLNIGYTTTNPYADGNLWTYNGTDYVTSTGDLTFRIGLLGTVRTRVGHFGKEPSAIALNALDLYNDEGGIITAGDVEESTFKTDYTFNTNTVLEVLNKVIELSFLGWWWSVDIANNTYNLKSLGTDPDHIFSLGKHIESFELDQTIEDIANIVYFSGGEVTPGTNLFLLTQDTDSMDNFRRGLVVKSDSRVTLTDSGRLLSQYEIDRFKDEHYRTQLTINSSVYDTETIEPGQIVSLANFDDSTGTLQLQIQSVRYTPDNVTIELDTLPRPVSRRLDNLRRQQLVNENTNNPNSPA